MLKNEVEITFSDFYNQSFYQSYCKNMENKINVTLDIHG